MTSKEPWTERHRPEEFDDIQGNTSALEDIQDWIDGWSVGDSPQLLVGDAGTGKTTTAYVAANYADLPLNQVDASSARQNGDVRRFVSEIRTGDQLVLLDEVDSWHHSVDLTPLHEELKEPSSPVVLTANEEYDVPTAIKSPSDTHEFKLSTSSRRAKIKEIAKAEGVPLDEKDLERLVERPDLRSAINDLQIHAEMGLPIGEDQREWDSSEFAAMDQILKYGDADDVDVRPPWLVMWLDQNVRKEYRGLEAAAAYDALARADVYLGGAQPGDYRGWRYAGVLAEMVGDLRLTEAYQGWISWDFPEWVRSTMPDPEDEESEEAALYREMSGYGATGTGLSGGYVYFLHNTLPILRRLPASEREQLIVDQSLTEEAAAALGVSSAEYEGITVYSEAEAGEGLSPDHGDALSGDW